MLVGVGDGLGPFDRVAVFVLVRLVVVLVVDDAVADIVLDLAAVTEEVKLPLTLHVEEGVAELVRVARELRVDDELPEEVREDVIEAIDVGDADLVLVFSELRVVVELPEDDLEGGKERLDVLVGDTDLEAGALRVDVVVLEEERETLDDSVIAAEDVLVRLVDTLAVDVFVTSVVCEIQEDEEGVLEGPGDTDAMEDAVDVLEVAADRVLVFDWSDVMDALGV